MRHDAMSESNGGMEKSTTVRIADVKLGDRHRRDLGDVDALVRSIQDIGLLHPIVVAPDMALIVGARRLEAYRRMGRTEIPARIQESAGQEAISRTTPIDRPKGRKDAVGTFTQLRGIPACWE